MPRRPIPEHLNRAIDQQWVNEVKLAQEEKRKPRAVNVWRAIHGNVLRDPSKEKQKFRRLRRIERAHLTSVLSLNTRPGALGWTAKSPRRILPTC
jgi:hypothetical protein